MTVLSSDARIILDTFSLTDLDVEKVSTENIKGLVNVKITIVSKPFPCPVCGCDSPKIKDYRDKHITHSALTNNTCTLVYHARRYLCPVCGRTYYERNPFVFKKQKISTLTVKKILEDLKSPCETFTSVAERYHISPTSVATIFDEHVEMPTLKLPKYLSIDEAYAFRSDDSKYVCMILDYITQEPVDLLPSRQKKYLLEYFKRIPYDQRNEVVMVNTDMYDVYRQVFKTVFKSYIHSVDHFHVSQELHRKLDRVRIDVMKKYAGSAPPGKRDTSDEYYLLKHMNWMIMKRPDAKDKDGNLLFDPMRPRKYNYHFKEELNYCELREKLLNIDAGLTEAEGLKNKFVDFYENNTYDTAEAALTELIKAFLESNVPEMREFAKTLLKWRIEIINSFIVLDYSYEVDKSTGQVDALPKRMNAGLIERKNGVLKLLKKGSMGYKNWDRFRNRCLYVLRKSATYRLNPIDTPKEELKYTRAKKKKLPKEKKKKD